MNKDVSKNKNDFAPIPPMGWNSYDYYDTSVNEAQILKNADYMAAHLKDFGWEYIVVDIEWYSHDAGSQRDKYQYIPFWNVEMDEYARLLPDPARFPSSAGGQGFKPLADHIHALGLKFGIHIMRGIPRIAAHNHTGLLGTDRTANEIADPSNICFWNPDMYGVNPAAEGAQEYYDSLFALYAEWGVDFVKCDDICRMDMPTAEAEIKMLHHAILKCGRAITLSLSPGPAKIEAAWLYEQNANMWRITDDFWDTWQLLRAMFRRCELWEKHVSQGCYPDCDMLPLGYLGKGFGAERLTGFTKDEQITMMTLWCIFKSPLMLGCELTKLDEWTLSLLTNKDVLSLLSLESQAHQLVLNEEQAVWFTTDPVQHHSYYALFNLSDLPQTFQVTLSEKEAASETCTELWTQKRGSINGHLLTADVPPHGAKLFRL